jgi:hypothetical protein
MELIMMIGVFDWDAMLNDDNNVYEQYEINTIKTNYENGLIDVYDVLDLCDELNIKIL